jgi:hypothetical protein
MVFSCAGFASPQAIDLVVHTGEVGADQEFSLSRRLVATQIRMSSVTQSPDFSSIVSPDLSVYSFIFFLAFLIIDLRLLALIAHFELSLLRTTQFQYMSDGGEQI